MGSGVNRLVDVYPVKLLILNKSANYISLISVYY